MQFDRSLLVILDEQDDSFLALRRSELIARQLHCGVRILWLGDNQTKALQLEEQLNSRGIHAVSDICDPRQMLKQVRQLWNSQHFALLVKRCDAPRQGFSASRDSQLLRELPCPVLLVKHDQPWHGQSTMAAINPMAKDQLHRQLNIDVMSLAAQIVRATEGQFVAASAAPSAMMGANPEMQSEALIQERVTQALQALLSESGLSADSFAVGEGPAEHWIPVAAIENRAALVVIGTKARSGLQGALIGNTAERILHRLDADVLVVRPGLAEAVIPMVTE
ncbi:MAG: universal stress protein [Amphritea sp.]|nr:universal stress protein [Amphritea sp.]